MDPGLRPRNLHCKCALSKKGIPQTALRDTLLMSGQCVSARTPESDCRDSNHRAIDSYLCGLGECDETSLRLSFIMCESGIILLRL